MNNYYKISETAITVSAEFIDESSEMVEIKLSADKYYEDHIFIELSENFIVIGTCVSNCKNAIKIYSAYKLKSLHML